MQPGGIVEPVGGEGADRDRLGVRDDWSLRSTRVAESMRIRLLGALGFRQGD